MEDKILNVKNRSTGMVVYNLDNGKIRRELAPGESIKIHATELEKLTYQPGGRELISRYLLITDGEEVLNALNVHREVEYYMQEQDIINMLRNGSNDEFMDCLDFAPQGVIDLILKYAVQLPLSDMNKVRILKDKTGFDVLAALKHKEEEQQAEEAPRVEAPVRRVQKEETKPTGRRTTPPKYNVVSRN